MDFISPVLNLVGSQLIAEYARIHGISDKLNSWGEKLPWIQAFLDSAEEKQMYDNDSATVLWLADLRDVAYDMEDLFDHFSVEAKRDESKAQSSKLPHCLIACCSPFRPRTLFSHHCMANEIDDIDRRLKDVYEKIPSLQLIQSWRRETRSERPGSETSSFRPDPKFVGREKQVEELLAQLTRSEATHGTVRPFAVVSIVGEGGVGKTTLAQELYNHVSLNFDVKAWACVSDVFDVTAITKSILDHVTSSSPSTEKDLNQLQNSLKGTLSGKKFLIVLDDVWNENYVDIETLLKPLYSGSQGSRILLTTRNAEVARKVGDPNPKQLEVLLPEQGLSLLAYHSIGEENFEGHPDLRDIAVELVNKCKWLPLSIKVIAGLLRFEKDPDNWRRVLHHGIWNLQGKIPSALRLSYIYLPIHLKRCFAACALFPKDNIFDQDELIQLWIIQGLLHKGTARTLREAGTENLRRLEALSFLQRARDDKNLYSMHALINALAKSVHARSYFSSDEFKEGSTSCEVLFLDKVRHAALVTQYCEQLSSKRFKAFRSMKKLRTFMPFQISKEREGVAFVSNDVIQDLIVDMKNLRMLSLRFFKIKQVPERIGEFKLLRSLDFSYTDIQVLPESICDLVELQFLLLRGCEELQTLPRNIHKLSNLLHLDITGTKVLQEKMPPCIGDLKKLEILSDFVVRKSVRI